MLFVIFLLETVNTSNSLVKFSQLIYLLHFVAVTTYIILVVNFKKFISVSGALIIVKGDKSTVSQRPIR